MMSREASSSQVPQEQMRQRAKTLLALNGNDRCFECHSPNPQWLFVNQGVVCCLNCTGALRQSSVEAALWNARSLTLDTLKEEWLVALEHWGNEKASQVFKSNSTYKYFHTKYTSREAHINRWKVACAVAAATGSAGSVPEEPANLPTQLDVPINHAKNFLLPIS